MKPIITAILALTTLSSFSQAETQPSEYLQHYQYTVDQAIELESANSANRVSQFSYISFDGQRVKGYISYPEKEAKSYPVLIGLHAMGRSAQRWWKSSINGRKTVTHVNKLAEMADKMGYVVIALDARAHGDRKDPNMGIADIMKALKKDNKPAPYTNMIVDTVKDYRVLLDWIYTQPNLDTSAIQLAGYSMGAQQSLLLAAVDERVNDVLAIVPPFIEEKELSLVSPVHLATLLKDKRVTLITADADEHASVAENKQLFNAIKSPNKQWAVVSGGHILPESYLSHLEHWLVVNEQVK